MQESNTVFGESGNDRISSPRGFASGGSGNDFIRFADCGGVAYGDGGNDEIRGGNSRVELHGSGDNDKLRGSDSGDAEKLFGDDGDDILTGGAKNDSAHHADSSHLVWMQHTEIGYSPASVNVWLNVCPEANDS
jgi:Ca2+-binding RTX toxin-like protein